MIREANLVDASGICAISSNDLGYSCSEALVQKRLQELDCKREVIYVAEIDGKLVGYVHAEIYKLLYFESMVNILGLAVSTEYRRQGIGRALMLQAESWAKKQGIRKIRLNSGGERKEAHEFYRAQGFDSEKAQICFMKDLDK